MILEQKKGGLVWAFSMSQSYFLGLKNSWALWSVVTNVISSKKQKKFCRATTQSLETVQQPNTKYFKLSFTQILITPTVLFAMIQFQSLSIHQSKHFLIFYCLPGSVLLQSKSEKSQNKPLSSRSTLSVYKANKEY